MIRELTGWQVFQDVNDVGLSLAIYEDALEQENYIHMMSPWETLEELTYLQKIYSDTPYHGRMLRSFNEAPWWYRCTFDVDKEAPHYALRFACVDYYCEVWVNGKAVGIHEGYQTPFDLNISDAVRMGKNVVYVRVRAPWDHAIDEGMENLRFFSIRRGMLKGNYEHADGLIQRDVNPIGIVGPVHLVTESGPYIQDLQAICVAAKDGAIRVNFSVSEPCSVHVEIRDKGGNLCAERNLEADGTISCEMVVSNPKLWNTWDHGGAYLYRVIATVAGSNEGKSARFGLVSYRFERTPDQTTFFINDKKIFLRGATYFPDTYFADLPEERLRRDLNKILEGGHNAIRVHVHVEQDLFYDLCDEMGLVVFQDTDFSWNHPTDQTWVNSSIAICEKIFERLRGHACLGCWMLLNEPDKWKTNVVNQDGCSLEEIIQRPDSITRAIGEPLLAAVRRCDPGRPTIRASYNEDDLESGDSHNYLGSLRGQETNYTDIDGTKEKLVTEFGVDAPGNLQTLDYDSAIQIALAPAAGRMDEIRRYQYKLIKYYIEHYRAQKYAPCGGYFHFMFIDNAPQSFLGVFDWWGQQKLGWQAILESNQPVCVMARKDEVHKREGFSIYLANDTEESLRGTIRWAFIRGGECILRGEAAAEVDADGIAECAFEITHPELSADLELDLLFENTEGENVARNHYIAPFLEMKHILGHPKRVNNELGMRLFAE